MDEGKGLVWSVWRWGIAVVGVDGRGVALEYWVSVGGTGFGFVWSVWCWGVGVGTGRTTRIRSFILVRFRMAAKARRTIK